jgi:hypothetical protein
VSNPISQGFADTAAFVRYARGLRTYMSHRVDEAEARRIIAGRLARREDNLVRLLEERIFGHHASPYKQLFANAGIGLPDAVAIVREEGVEGALDRFYDAGIYVTIDEFKGRVPIQRGSLTLDVRDVDFDNPRSRYVLTSSSSGSRGPARRTKFDFEYMEDGAVLSAITGPLQGRLGRPTAIWRPVPPGGGLRSMVNHVKRGEPVDRWFTQVPLRFTPQLAREYLLTRYTIAASRRLGTPIPEPEYVPLDRAVVIARWLADQTAKGTPAHFSAFASSGVRVCLAAKEASLDISGTAFRFGGEPLTKGKVGIVEELGATVQSGYAMTEVGGGVGITCMNRVELDEVHLGIDRLGVIQRERDAGGTRVGALLFTTLLPTSAKVLLNYESGDHGTLTQRDCGCPIGELGFERHLHTIRSYEKLTSEGMNFVGSDLLRLIEDVLPNRFGGGPPDYQLVEEEVDGLPKVSIFVNPRLGALDEDAIVRTVVEGLGSGPAYKDMMATFWDTGHTLRVVRQEPYATSTGKVAPFHITRR